MNSLAEINRANTSRRMKKVHADRRAAADAPVRYVVGFCFNPSMTHVALIEKLKPEWQKGKLNGVGGKVEDGETAGHAMVREFYEEAGVCIADWLHFHTERFLPSQEAVRQHSGGAIIYHFAAVALPSQWIRVKTREAEKIYKIDYPLNRVFSFEAARVIYNLEYLIPMAAVLLAQPPENRPVII